MRQKWLQRIARFCRFTVGAAVCSRDVCMHTPAGSSAATFNGSAPNGRLYRSHRIPLLLRCAVPLIPAFTLILASPVSAQTPGALPTITPVQVQPLGPASGGGVVTRVTYEMRLAANDAGVATAANDARYISRAVTIAGPTMGGIVRGVVAGGSRLVPWVSAALLAYEAYKWYTDSGNLMQPGEQYPQVNCAGSNGYWTSGNAPEALTCSLPGMRVALKSHFNTQYAPNYVTGIECQSNGTCTYQIFNIAGNRTDTHGAVADFHAGVAPSGTKDVAYADPDTQVTDARLGQLSDQHPDWWPDMLRDPLTNQPLITPEIAADMDALKHQIAPDYGVDPQNIPQTTPDPNYQQGQAPSRPQSLPDYCAWAARACEHYDFVEDKLTVPTFDPTMGGDHSASDVMVEKTDDGSASLDASGFLGGGACPGLPAIEYFGQSIDYSEGLCRTAGLFGPWLVGMGYALALLIGLRLKAGG